MQTVKSKDKTRIAYKESGGGKPLIIIGGSLADHKMYVPLADALSKNLTVFNYDRRNRGQSDASVEHTVEHELQDLEALISLCEETPVIYGHSAGTALAIKAVAVGFSIDKLILADLPFSPFTENSETEVEKFLKERNTILGLLQRNDKVGAVKFFLKDFGMNDQELDNFMLSENGNQAITNSITLPIDYDLLGSGMPPVEELIKIKVPTLLITSNYGLGIAEDISKYISKCKIEILDNPTYDSPATKIAESVFNFLAQI